MRLAAEPEELLQLEDHACLKVYLGDESGFCLTPSVPYGWQPSGTYTGILAQKSPRRPVFGLLCRDNTFEGYDTLGPMNAEVVAACLDDFATKTTQKTVMVLDNASFHRAALITDKIEAWQEKALYIWFLPAYSPHLNLIETLWRKVKYEWLKPHHFVHWQALNDALDEIFNNIGNKYKIAFT